MTRITSELGRKLRVYALAVAGGLFHLVLTYEAPIHTERLQTEVGYDNESIMRAQFEENETNGKGEAMCHRRGN